MEAGAVANGDTGPGCLPSVTELMGACEASTGSSACDSTAHAGLGTCGLQRWIFRNKAEAPCLMSFAQHCYHLPLTCRCCRVPASVAPRSAEF